MFERRKIGSINSLSPAQKIRGWLVSITARILFALISSFVLYLIFRYVVLGVINFLSTQVLEAGPIDENNKIFTATMVVIIILVDIYILKDRLSKRKWFFCLLIDANKKVVSEEPLSKCFGFIRKILRLRIK